MTDAVQQEHTKDKRPPDSDDNFQVVESVPGPINQAYSCNSKPPTLGGGVFTRECCTWFRNLLGHKSDFPERLQKQSRFECRKISHRARDYC